MSRDKSVWLFNCADTFSGNPKWLFIYVSRFRPDIDAYWICDSNETTSLVRSHGYKAVTFASRQGIALQQLAGVFVVNQVKARIPELLDGIVLLNLWHGVGVKSIERAATTANAGYLHEHIAGKYIRNNEYYRRHQLFLVTSPAMEEHFRVQIGLDDETVIRGGYPQNLYPRLHEFTRTFDHALLRAGSDVADARVVLYAPTYRRFPSGSFIHAALPDVEALLATLERENLVLVLKMHPHVQDDPGFVALREHYGTHPRLVFWNNDNDVYEVFGEIDTAIVDYSSILYDLIAAGVTRFVRYTFDLADDVDAIADGMDYLALSCGTLASTFPALLKALATDNTVDAADLSRLEEHFWSYSDDQTFERLVDRAIEFTPRVVDLPTLYSFDIFDTLIHRRGVLPESIPPYVEAQMAASGGYPVDLVRNYRAVRAQAEANAREFHRKQHSRAASGHLEIQFTDIFDRIADVYGLDRAQANALAQWEIDAELASVVPDAVNVARVDELLAAGETVVLISDMYLPRAVVTELLRRAHPPLASLPLFLSSERGVQKTTRRLFLAVYDELGYDFREWKHVGDNAFADVKQPAALGISAEKAHSPRLSTFEALLASKIGTYDGYVLAGMLRSLRTRSRRNAAQVFVQNHVSSYLVPYVDWLISDAVERGYETLYFVSRDGYHMKRIADELIAARGTDVQTRYIYGSRTAWRVASQIDSIDEDFFLPHGNLSGVRTPAELLAAARLDRETFLAMLPELGRVLDLPEIDPATRDQIGSALSTSRQYADHLLQVAADERATVAGYLRQEIDFSRKFAFVEYWGRGYTQDCLARLIADAAGQEIPTPMYYARSIYPSQGASIRHSYTTARMSMLFIEAVFANLPYGTVTGYTADGDRIKPVYARRRYDRRLHRALKLGLVEFAREYAQLPLLDRATLGRAFFRFGFDHFRTHPTSPAYVKNLAPLRDSVQLGGAEHAFAPPISWHDALAEFRTEVVKHGTRSIPLSERVSRPEVVRALARARRWRRGAHSALVTTIRVWAETANAASWKARRWAELATRREAPGR